MYEGEKKNMKELSSSQMTLKEQNYSVQSN